MDIVKILIMIIHIGTPAEVHDTCMAALSEKMPAGSFCEAFAMVKEEECLIGMPNKNSVTMRTYQRLLSHEMMHCAGWHHENTVTR